MVGLISTCHDAVLCPSSFKPGTSRIEVASVTASLTCSVVDRWCHLPLCPLCLPLLSHRVRFKPLRLSCLALTARGLSLRFHEAPEDRAAACSPMSHRAPVGTELVSYLVAVFRESRVATVSFKSAPPSVRVEQLCCRWRLVVKFDRGTIVKHRIHSQLNWAILLCDVIPDRKPE